MELIYRGVALPDRPVDQPIDELRLGRQFEWRLVVRGALSLGWVRHG